MRSEMDLRRDKMVPIMGRVKGPGGSVGLLLEMNLRRKKGTRIRLSHHQPPPLTSIDLFFSVSQVAK